MINFTSMKILLLAISLILSSALQAQTDYESPYVYEGKTFTLTFPSGYYHIPEFNSNDGMMLTTDPNFDASSLDGAPSNINTLAIFYMDRITAGEDVQSFVETEITDDQETEVLTVPTYKTLDIAQLASLTVKVEDDNLDIMYTGILHFGEHRIMLMLIPKADEIAAKDQKDFESLINSLRVIETDKENELFTKGLIDDDLDDFEFFANTKFETNFSYDDIFFEAEETMLNWQEYEDLDQATLLSSYINYKTVGDKRSSSGMIKVFSAGELSQYPDIASKVEALHTIFPQHMFKTITAKSSFRNTDDNLEIIEYSFMIGTKAPTKVQAVYSVIEQGELIFIVVEKGENSTDNVGSSARSFIETLWIWDNADFEELNGEE